ncbi:MAG: iron chaperone [Aggregatilineales bacterium]
MKTGSSVPQTIDDYIAGFPPDVQVILQKIRSVVRAAAPDAEEAIKYQMPTFVLRGNLVHFAAFKNHIGFYPTPNAIERFQKELAGCAHAKGSA